MSIVTKRGDGGTTGLAGGRRVSKGSARIECIGAVDELNSFQGLARAATDDAALAELVESVQRELFAVGETLAAPPDTPAPAGPAVTAAMVERLTAEAARLEAVDGVLDDWSLPGTHPVASLYDVARAACRRAERAIVRLADAEPVAGHVIPWVNRLSDLLWLVGRVIECAGCGDGRLRRAADPRSRWSRAW